MAFKLLATAQQRWRRLDGAHLLPLLLAGVKFVDGVQNGSGNANATAGVEFFQIQPDTDRCS